MTTTRIGLFAALALLATAFAPASAQSPGAKAVADKLAKDYGVTVLKTTESEIDGKTVLLVTVMNEGGDFNSAFQVTTLAVDPATGALVSQYRTTPSGQQDLAPGRLSPRIDDAGEIIRQLSTRPAGR